jgi:hypothetical protein
MADIYVYRIAHTNDDGVAIDLPWEQVEARCEILGLKTVPEYARFIYDGDRDKLSDMMDTASVGSSVIDDRHIREGAVLRIESGDGVKFLKLKSHTFGLLEGYIKEQDDYIDMEEIA